MRGYVDSNILIWHLRGEPNAHAFLKTLRDSLEYDLWLGAMQRSEIVFFMRSEEREQTMALLSIFSTSPVDQMIVDDAGAMFRRWHPTHGVDANDMLLAATVRRTGGKIYTLNDRHFPMPDVIVERPW